MPTDEETVPLLVTLGHTGDRSFNLRFPSDYAPEIIALLDEHEIAHDTILEFSAGQELWIEAVRVLSVPGGLAALASIIKTVVHRHDGKRFILKRGGEEFEATGFSEEKVRGFLEKAAADQVARDAEWGRVLRAQDAKVDERSDDVK
jgi:hypothetical protein